MVLIYIKQRPVISITQYGPGSPIFYLPAILGQSPQSVINIASCFCFIVLLLVDGPYSVEGLLAYLLLFLYILVFAGCSYFLDKATHTLFQIHHDLPVLAYLALGSWFLLRKSSSYNFYKTSHRNSFSLDGVLVKNRCSSLAYFFFIYF